MINANMARKRVDYAVAEMMYREGSTLREIGERLAVTRAAVSDGLAIRGVLSRRRLKVRLTPSDVELAYIAGLFDGEGHISIVLSKSERINQYWLQIGVTNMNKDIIEYLASSFGVGHVFVRRQNDRRLACWKWQCTNADPAHVLKALAPHLRIKADACVIGLEFQSRINERNNIECRAGMKWKLGELNRAT